MQIFLALHFVKELYLVESAIFWPQKCQSFAFFYFYKCLWREIQAWGLRKGLTSGSQSLGDYQKYSKQIQKTDSNIHYVF